ncbi:MAG: DUF805 domain-containing protein [Bacteroidia bacterium]
MQEKSIIQYFKEVVTENYANFSGRARRREYWSFQLVSTIASLILSTLDYALFNTGFGDTGIIGSIFSLAILVPSLAVFVRRLHDVGKSGWYILLMLLPIIGWIWLLVLLFTDGDQGTNEYGPNPKNPDFEEELDQIGTE